MNVKYTENLESQVIYFFVRFRINYILKKIVCMIINFYIVVTFLGRLLSDINANMIFRVSNDKECCNQSEIILRHY